MLNTDNDRVKYYLINFLFILFFAQTIEALEPIKQDSTDPPSYSIDLLFNPEVWKYLTPQTLNDDLMCVLEPPNEEAWRFKPSFIIPREEWGAIELDREEESYECLNYLSHLNQFSALRGKPSSTLSLQDIYSGGRVVLHHTAANSTSIKTLDETAFGKGGYITVEYHYFISKEGEVFEARPLFLAGANAGISSEKVQCHGDQRHRNFNFDYDYRSIGIALEGNLLKNDEYDNYYAYDQRRSRKWLKEKKLTPEEKQRANELGLKLENEKYSNSAVEKIFGFIKNNKYRLYDFTPHKTESLFMLQRQDPLIHISPQYMSLKRLIKELHHKLGISEVVGHKHVRHRDTYCPGEQMLDLIKADFKTSPERININFEKAPRDNQLEPPALCIYRSSKCAGSWCDRNPEKCERVQEDG